MKTDAEVDAGSIDGSTSNQNTTNCGSTKPYHTGANSINLILIIILIVFFNN